MSQFLVVFVCKFLNIITPKNAIYSLYLILLTVGGWRSLLRHCAMIRKIAGSIPDGCMNTFHWFNPSGRTMSLRSNQHLKEMSIRGISWWVKAAGTTFMCYLEILGASTSWSCVFCAIKIIRRNVRLYKYHTMSGPHHKSLQPASIKILVYILVLYWSLWLLTITAMYAVWLIVMNGRERNTTNAQIWRK